MRSLPSLTGDCRLPAMHAVQPLAMACWNMTFQAEDQGFLHRIHAFSVVSRIVSQTTTAKDEALDRVQMGKVLESGDIPLTQPKASSRVATIGNLFDGSTETVWESDNGDMHYCEFLVPPSAAGQRLTLAVCLDNVRNKDYAVREIAVQALWGSKSELLETIKVPDQSIGWHVCRLAGLPTPEGASPELRVRVTFTPSQSRRPVRVQQLRVSSDGVVDRSLDAVTWSALRTKLYHEQALKLFHELSLQVFQAKATDGAAAVSDEAGELKQHVVGLLFDQKAPLSKVQTAVCEHLLRELQQEACSDQLVIDDAYSFELVSIVASLVNSAAGIGFLLAHLSAISDLLTMLQRGSDRCQRALLDTLGKIAAKVSARVLTPRMQPVLCGGQSVSGLPARLLFVLAQTIELQVRVRGAKRAGNKESWSMRECVSGASALCGGFGCVAELRALLLELLTVPEWKEITLVGILMRATCTVLIACRIVCRGFCAGSLTSPQSQSSIILAIRACGWRWPRWAWHRLKRGSCFAGSSRSRSEQRPAAQLAAQCCRRPFGSCVSTTRMVSQSRRHFARSARCTCVTSATTLRICGLPSASMFAAVWRQARPRCRLSSTRAASGSSARPYSSRLTL